MPVGVRRYMAHISPQQLEHKAVLDQLNLIDLVCSYYMNNIDGMIYMFYGDHEISLNQEEAKRVRGL